MRELLLVGKFNSYFHDLSRELESRFQVQACLDNADMMRDIVDPNCNIIFGASVDDSMEEIRELIRSNHHTRFPVCDEDKDHVLGILHVRDLFNAKLTPDFDIRLLLRKTIMVPEGMNALRVLQTMQKQRVHLAIVVDEYGGLSGVVTLEDVLEEMLGSEIVDESDKVTDMRALAKARAQEEKGRN